MLLPVRRQCEYGKCPNGHIGCNACILRPLAGRKGRRRAQMADTTLEQYRRSIDNIDAALVYMLAERFKVTQAVGRHKAETNLPPADPMREERQIARLRALAADAELDPDFTEKFLRFIIEEVIRHHQKIGANHG
jgi:chorismate mutase